jgi:O-antigen/teichoic acid export membrane protein
MSFKLSATRGVKWTSVSQFGRQGMQFVTTAILAHLLSPADFGLLGMATVVTGFVALFKDLGTSAAIIHKKDISENLLSSIFWINVAFGFLAMVVLFFLSPLIAAFYKEPRVEPLLKALSLSFFASGLGILHQAVLERQLAFSKLAILEITATLIGSVVGITAALLGCGTWSLVYQMLFVTIATTILLWRSSSWRPKLIVSWHEIKTVSSYSMNLTGFNIFNYFARNADNLLIGKFLGAQELGYYSLAYRLMFYPLQSISGVIGRVMFPLYSQIQADHDRFRDVYLKIAAAISFITFPLMLVLLALTQPVIVTVFGSQWIPVVLLVKILIPVGMAQSIVTTVGMIYQSKGRTDWMFRWGIFSGAIVTIGFVIGLQWGVIGVAASYLVTSFLLTYPNFVVPFRLIDLNVVDLGKVLLRPLACSILIYIFLVVIANIEHDLSEILVLSISIPVAMFLYLIASWAFNREQMNQLMNLIGLKRFFQQFGTSH